jgi:hypothetical protein
MPLPNTERKGKTMHAEGMLSIVRRETMYQARYASSNPQDVERAPHPCRDEGALVALLHDCGLDTWSITQASTELRKGRVAVLPLVCAQAQIQAYFPPAGPLAQTQAAA